MDGMSVRFQAEIPRVAVFPRIASTLTPSVTIAAAAASGVVGTMDTTPTDVEVTALMKRFDFAAEDRVVIARLDFQVVPATTSAVQCLLAVVNALSDVDAALELSNYRAIPISANEVTPIVVPEGITSIHIVAAPSGVAGGVYTGTRLFITGFKDA